MMGLHGKANTITSPGDLPRPYQQRSQRMDDAIVLEHRHAAERCDSGGHVNGLPQSPCIPTIASIRPSSAERARRRQFAYMGLLQCRIVLRHCGGSIRFRLFAQRYPWQGYRNPRLHRLNLMRDHA